MHVVVSSLQGSLQCRQGLGGLAMQGFVERPVEAPVDSMAALHVQVCSSNLPFLKILRLPANIATVIDRKNTCISCYQYMLLVIVVRTNATRRVYHDVTRNMIAPWWETL